MIRVLTEDRSVTAAVNELLKEIPNGADIEGELALEQIGGGLSLTIQNGQAILGYSDRRSLLRGVGLYIQHRDEKELSLTEEPRFDIVGMMADVSRNAVLTVESVKKLARLSALVGMNALMLYTEDTYEIKEFPYFGHLRGRYTPAELREIDDYCDLLGIELIPCIQTLAHLNAIFEWPAFGEYHDCNDIMLAESEKVYEMISCMFRTVSENIRSRKINLGLDEAHMLGVGRYLDKNGYHKRSDIMLRHMNRVMELCREYGYQPRMWSDMFFRMLNDGVYRVKGTVVPPEIVAGVPEEMTLVYWDYREPHKESYDEMFRQHSVFHNPIAFAGGDSSWYGVVPLNRLGYRATCSALESAMEHGTREVYCTMWKDDGAACSFFSSLHVLFAYGEICWRGDGSEAHLRERMAATVGVSFDDMLSIEDINDVPGRALLGYHEANPNKYMFYENILTGKFACHIPDGSAAHFAHQAGRMRACADRAGAYRYVYDTLAALCDVLAEKAELGKELYRAYHDGDRETLHTIATERIEIVKALVEEFRLSFRRRWLTESKSFGFDVMDIRIGGVTNQLDTAQYLLEEYLAGRLERIDELEADRLPYGFDGNVRADGDIILLNRWQRMGAQVISNMF